MIYLLHLYVNGTSVFRICKVIFHQIIPTSGPHTPRILGLSQPAGNERPPTAKKTPAEVKSFVGMEYNWDGGDEKCSKEYKKSKRICFVCFEKDWILHLKRAVKNHRL